MTQLLKDYPEIAAALGLAPAPTYDELGKLVFDIGKAAQKATLAGVEHGKAESAKRIAELEMALAPFVAEYRRMRDPGTDDLYDEQPYSCHVLLGDVRRAARVLP